MLAAAVFAQAGSGPTVDAAIGMLDSATLAERVQATQRLLDPDGLTLPEAEHLLASDALTPETRLRLESIGAELFAREPRAGLGVRFAPAPDGAGAPLDMVMPNFPAAGFLQAGDIVVTVDGEPMVNTTHMGTVILSHAPGDVLHVEIDRPVVGEGLPTARRLAFDVPLGRFEDLGGTRLEPARLEAAFRYRLARHGVSHEPPLVGSGLTPLEWVRAEGYDERAAKAPEIKTRPVAAWRVLSFGGQPESSVAEIELRRGDPNAMIRRVSIALQADGLYDQIEEALAGYRAIVRRLAELRAIMGEATLPRPGDEQARGIDRVQAERDELESGLTEIVRTLEAAPGDSVNPPP